MFILDLVLEDLKIHASSTDAKEYDVRLTDTPTGATQEAKASSNEMCAILDCAISMTGVGHTGSHAVADEWCKKNEIKFDLRPCA